MHLQSQYRRRALVTADMIENINDAKLKWCQAGLDVAAADGCILKDTKIDQMPEINSYKQ